MVDLPTVHRGELMTIHDRTHRRRHRLALPLTAILTVLIGAPLVGAPSPAAAAAVATQAPAAATADAVLTWNVHAETAIWVVARQNPWVQARSFAMVQGAVYDAVNAIAGKPYQPFLVAPPATGAESTEAAVATAAHLVLTALFPDQRDRLRAEYDAYLATVPDGPAEQGGMRYCINSAALEVKPEDN